MIRVVIVDDSPVVRELLSQSLRSDASVRIVGLATDGLEALELARRIRPDLITMDVNMPKMNGLEAIRQIMDEVPTPILVITTEAGSRELDGTFQALACGAVSVLRKPDNFLGEPGEEFTRLLLMQVRAFARQSLGRMDAPSGAPRPGPIEGAPGGTCEYDILGIGTSAGGPVALSNLFLALPRRVEVPIIVVQHITQGFLANFVAWLSRQVRRDIRILGDGEEVTPGLIYFAPEDHHVEISPMFRARLRKTPPVGGFRPSTDHLFRSLATSFRGRAIGLLLTGMGRDGADGLCAIRRAGGVTLAQDEASSLVFGMAKQALSLGAVEKVMSLDALSRRLAALICRGMEETPGGP